MKYEKFDQLIILDDDSYGRVKDFIKYKGLEYLKEEFEVEQAFAVIADTKGKSFNMYCDGEEKSVWKQQIGEEFFGSAAKEILKKADAEGKRLLILCDWDWKLDIPEKAIQDSLNVIVEAFEKAQKRDDRDGDDKTGYREIAMIFYTSVLEKNVNIPNQRGQIRIRQKAILDWRWQDITSSVSRVKAILPYYDIQSQNR